MLLMERNRKIPPKILRTVKQKLVLILASFENQQINKYKHIYIPFYTTKSIHTENAIENAFKLCRSTTNVFCHHQFMYIPFDWAREGKLRADHISNETKTSNKHHVINTPHTFQYFESHWLSSAVSEIRKMKYNRKTFLLFMSVFRFIHWNTWIQNWHHHAHKHFSFFFACFVCAKKMHVELLILQFTTKQVNITIAIYYCVWKLNKSFKVIMCWRNDGKMYTENSFGSTFWFETQKLSLQLLSVFILAEFFFLAVVLTAMCFSISFTSK